MFFKPVTDFINKNKLLLIILFVAGILRFTNLGYSDYQGDEIKALYLPENGQSFSSFLLDQRKGPMQFFVTYLLKFADPTYDNQFLMRLPFALAGFLSVFFFFKLLEKHFGEKIAFYASFFLATNGFFIAFSRIVQYQCFTILFAILALYCLSQKKIFFGLTFWAFSLLSHYDGVFIAPLAFYFLYTWYGSIKVFNKKKFLTLLSSGLLAAVLLAAFYIPFVLTLSSQTLDYWEGRISGDVSSKTSSSHYLFTVYQPIYVVHIYTILGVLGFFALLVTLLSLKVKNKLLAGFTSVINIGDAKVQKLFIILIWFLISFVFMEVFVYIPGTHIYTYLLPLFVFLGFGILIIEKLLYKFFGGKYGNFMLVAGVALIFTFIAVQAYFIYDDNTREYPWENEQFIVWTFPRPTPIFHLSMFGFPYYRNWEGIRDFIVHQPEVTAYTTNERDSIARYYIHLEKDTQKAGFMVYIKNPQSFTNDITNPKVSYYVGKLAPMFVFSRNGREFVQIYNMPTGDIPIDAVPAESINPVH